MGGLPPLQWARANVCECNWGTCMVAAEGGHLEVLQWAWANGCQWNADACYAAAGGGSCLRRSVRHPEVIARFQLQLV